MKKSRTLYSSDFKNEAVSLVLEKTILPPKRVAGWVLDPPRYGAG